MTNQTKLSPFDHAAAIAESVQDKLKTGTISLAGYNQFMINRALAHRRDSIEAVNMVNGLKLSDFAHYHVLRTLIPKRRPGRDERWAKAAKHDSVKEVVDFYGISESRALEMIDACGVDAVLNEIKSRKGGKI